MNNVHNVFFLFYAFLKEKGKGGIKPRNSSRSGFSRARGGRGTYYRGVGSDPHAEGRGRGREEQRGRGSVNDGQRRSRGRRGNFVLLPLPLKSDLGPFFFRPDSSSLPRDEFVRKRGFSVVNLMASVHL